MNRLEIQPFADEHLNDSARLLAARHARHRAAEPLLSARFEEPSAALEELERVWQTEGASGAAGSREGRVVGYLIGAPRPDPSWGLNTWIEAEGFAVEELEDIRDLYGIAAARWVEEGRTRHYALVPATRELVEPWSRLGFGQQQAHGICEVTARPWPDGVRRAEKRDVEAVVAMAPLIGNHQFLSPVFSGVQPDYDVDELRTEIETDIDNPEVGNLVAEVDGRLAGNFELVAVEKSSMHLGLAGPDRACYLGFAVTEPAVRGSGAGVALTEAGFAWAHEQGYPTMVTDWRVTNLLSSRFWPKRGFRVSFLRLYRSIP